MSDPIPMRPERTLTADTLRQLAVFGIGCALGLATPRDMGWALRVIADAGIDTEKFRSEVQATIDAQKRIRTQAPVADLVGALRRDGLI